MARLHIRWFERHFEKIIFVAAGSVLLTVAFFYGIQSPSTITVDGKELGPRAFYAALGQKAKEASRAIKNGMLPRSRMPHVQLAALELPIEPLPPFLPPGVAVPKINERGGFGSDPVKLATILAPTKPVVSTGKAWARIPPTREVDVMNAGRGIDEPTYIPNKDWHWATLAAVVSRRSQQEAFFKAHYGSRRLRLIVADVEAERQERLPNGKWSSGSIVKPYLPVRLVGPRDVPLQEGRLGFEIDSRDWEYIRAYREQLATAGAQAAILRAPFQDYLADESTEEDDRVAWRVPETLRATGGTELDLTHATYGICFVSDQKSVDSGDSTNQLALIAQCKKARDTIAKGWQEVGPKAYLEAADLLRSLEQGPNTIPHLSRSATRLLDEYDRETRMASLVYQTALKEQETTVGLGPALEPMWVTDTTVEPGKTYRYRLRLLALNPYAGLPGLLADPHDAGRVIIAGEWSPGSEELRVQPTRYWFVLGPDDEQQHTVRVELHQWSDGAWHRGIATVGVGDSIAVKKGNTELKCDSIVRSIDFHRQFLEPVSSNNETNSATPLETVAVTLVNSKGETEERFAARDIVVRRSLLQEIRAELKRRDTLKATTSALSTGTHSFASVSN